jgi:hypothetical protein
MVALLQVGPSKAVQGDEVRRIAIEGAIGGDDGVGSISACAANLEDSDQRRGIAGIGL